MRRKSVTAADVMRRLEADPDYVARRKEQERLLGELERECREDEAALVGELRSLGYDVGSVWDLVNAAPHPVLERRFVGPYARAYVTLARHLGVPHHPRVREGVIRALTVANGGTLVETALFDAFERETNADLRWVLANALRVAMPYRHRRKHPQIALALKPKQPANKALQPPASGRG